MDKKVFTVILSLALIVSFFLPLFGSGSTGISAYKIVFGITSSVGSASSAVRFLWLLLPIVGLIILIGALGTWPSSYSGSVSWIPIAVIVFFIVRTFFVVKITPGEYLRSLGIGYWIALVASVLLAFGRPSRS